MGRIANRQIARVTVNAKEMVAEYHEHWEWYDEYLASFDNEDDGVRYVFPSSSDKNPALATDDDDQNCDDFDSAFDYSDEIYLETTYHP